jgi:hypothetical protein
MSAFDSVRFTSGRPLLGEITSDKLNAILAEIRKNRPRGERGITVRESGDATYIGLAAAIKGGGQLPAPHPWDIYIVSSEDDQYTVKVRPGTVAGILPSNWDDEFTCSKDELYYAKANVTTDGLDVTAVSIVIDTAPPATQEAQQFAIDTEVEILFGLFENQGFRTTSEGDISAVPTRVFTTTKDPAAAPGESPYVLWYKLV